jgi:hypothetical protein
MIMKLAAAILAASLATAGPTVAEPPLAPTITDGAQLVRLFGKTCAENGQVPAYAVTPPGQHTLVPVCTYLEDAGCQNRAVVLIERGVPPDTAWNEANKCELLIDGRLAIR